jgi:hypothetical protein
MPILPAMFWFYIMNPANVFILLWKLSQPGKGSPEEILQNLNMINEIAGINKEIKSLKTQIKRL